MRERTIAVRPYVDADLDGVLELLRAALGETAVLRRSPELFAWKHLTNPFGRSILLVAEADATIVGLRAFMRWELATPQGKTLRCVRAVDTATHPNYQRRGIFRKLTLAALEAAHSDGVDMVFNTPNPKSGAGYLRMGWREIGTIGVLAAPSRGMFAAKVSPDELPAPADYVRNSKPVGALDVGDRKPMGLRTPRTPEYLRWRFTEHPTARYVRIDAGDSVAIARPNIRNNRRELVLSDVYGPNPAAAIGRTIWHSRAAYVAGWFGSGSPERRAAATRGMLRVPRIETLTLVANPLRSLPVDIGSLEDWDFASSDLELL